MLVTSGVDLESLPAPRLINALAYLHVEDGMTEYGKERDQARARVLRAFKGYNNSESYGMSNDTTGPMGSGEPLPYIPPTEQTEDGYVGLDPPLG